LNATERGHEVRSRELQFLPQREREPEAVHQAEGESDDPAAAHVAADDVLEREVDDRSGDQRLHERREP
jgi:hypothetical protein